MIFYGAYPSDENVASCFDLMRYLAEPDFFRRAHITIRGPYQRKINIRAFNDNLFSMDITAPGSFFFGPQNTVFLKCEMPGVMDVWDKPDYPNSVPHLTIYDGKSRKFGSEIRNLLLKYRWNFSVEVTRLQIIEKKKDPHEFLDFYFQRMSTTARLLLSQPISVAAFQTIGEFQRLIWMERVCDHLHERFGPLLGFKR